MTRAVVEFFNCREAGLNLVGAVARLAAWHWAQGRRVLIRAEDAAQAHELDRGLWAFDPDSFLPHALAGGEDQATEPVLIETGEENPNQAPVLILAFPARPTPVSGWERVIQVIPPQDGPALEACRALYKELKEAGQVELIHSTRAP